MSRFRILVAGLVALLGLAALALSAAWAQAGKTILMEVGGTVTMGAGLAEKEADGAGVGTGTGVGIVAPELQEVTRIAATATPSPHLMSIFSAISRTDLLPRRRLVDVATCYEAGTESNVHLAIATGRDPRSVYGALPFPGAG